jgi:serine protease Do
MNTAIIPYGQGIGFAVAVNPIKRAVEDIVAHRHVTHPWLGVGLANITPDIARQLNVPTQNGALIRSIVPESPASNAGLQPGDVVVAFNGTKIGDTDTLRRAIEKSRAGERVKVTVYREQKRLDVPVTIGDRPPPKQLQQPQ